VLEANRPNWFRSRPQGTILNPMMNHSMNELASSFQPPRPLQNAHLMTLMPRYWPRDTSLLGLPQEERLFTVEPHSQLKGYCHWQIDRKSSPTAILVHGLEGCSESRYMRGIAAKAYRVGFNIIRMNQRTCGGTEHLSPTLYNSGLSGDYRAIVNELVNRDGLGRIWLVGYSMGGNLVLKAAGELGRSQSALAGAAAVCPNINPTVCARALEEPRNWMYHRHFVTRLKSRLRRKAALFPGQWDLSMLDQITTISEFDDRYTARDGGYRDGADYYNRAGARHVLDAIAVPTLIITAQDDPFIPYSMFTEAKIQWHPQIVLVAPRYGGHCGFFHRSRNGEDSYWAENRILDFLRERI
jgi:predicted alpha/beta-fold hydrolase